MSSNDKSSDDKARHVTVAIHGAMLARTALELLNCQERGRARLIMRQIAKQFDDLVPVVEKLP